VKPLKWENPSAWSKTCSQLYIGTFFFNYLYKVAMLLLMPVYPSPHVISLPHSLLE
jgi:hypothetical protein